MAKDGYYRSNNTRIKAKPEYLTAEQAEKIIRLFGDNVIVFVPGYLDAEAEAEKKAAIAKREEKELKDLEKSIAKLTKKEEKGTLTENETKQLEINRARIEELNK